MVEKKNQNPYLIVNDILKFEKLPMDKKNLNVLSLCRLK